MEIFKKEDNKKFQIKKSTLVLSCVLILQIYQISRNQLTSYQLRKDPIIRIGEAQEDFCFYTVKSLIDGSFSWMMFDEITYKGLKAEPNYFEFKNDEKIKTVKIKGDQCRVLTEADGRLKGLLITLNESINNPLYYKAIQINEDEMPSDWSKN